MLKPAEAKAFTLPLAGRVGIVGQGSWQAPAATLNAQSQLYVSYLYLNYAAGPVSVRLGKLRPETGFLWKDAPAAVYGRPLAASGYAPVERLGVAASTTYSAGVLGTQTIRGTIFTPDTTRLSRAWAEQAVQPGGVEPAADQTVRISRAAALALDGSKPAGISGLRYHVGLIQRGPEGPGEAAETGFDAALAYRLPVGSATVTPIVQHSRFHNAGRAQGRRVDFTTVGGEFRYKRWQLATTYTIGGSIDPAGQPSKDSDLTISTSLALGNGVEIGGSMSRKSGSGPAITTGRATITYKVRF